jgi:hypothetical protein
MADGSDPIRLKTVREVTLEAPTKVGDLARKKTYESPKLISYPVYGKMVLEPTFMGHPGGGGGGGTN